MPGLKALADRLPFGDISRSVTLYTGSFSIGVGLSFLVAQLVADSYGWRAAFYVTGAGPLIMILVCLWLTPRKPPPTHGHLLDFRPVLRNRAALGYIFGYGAHCFELYGMRTWIVAFWTFVVARNDGTAPLGAVTVSVIITLLSLPASVMGNEAALRYGRHRAITTVMIASGAIALAIGFNVEASPLLLLFLVFVYGLTVPADFGGADVWHDGKRGADASWGNLGFAFDSRIWPFSTWRMERRRCAGCGWRSGATKSVARLVCAACSGYLSWPFRFVVVEGG